jgi:hypothetical protein
LVSHIIKHNVTKQREGCGEHTPREAISRERTGSVKRIRIHKEGEDSRINHDNASTEDAGADDGQYLMHTGIRRPSKP